MVLVGAWTRKGIHSIYGFLTLSTDFVPDCEPANRRSITERTDRRVVFEWTSAPLRQLRVENQKHRAPTAAVENLVTESRKLETASQSTLVVHITNHITSDNPSALGSGRSGSPFAAEYRTAGLETALCSDQSLRREPSGTGQPRVTRQQCSPELLLAQRKAREPPHLPGRPYPWPGDRLYRQYGAGAWRRTASRRHRGLLDHSSLLPQIRRHPSLLHLHPQQKTHPRVHSHPNLNPLLRNKMPRRIRQMRPSQSPTSPSCPT